MSEVAGTGVHTTVGLRIRRIGRFWHCDLQFGKRINAEAYLEVQTLTFKYKINRRTVPYAERRSCFFIYTTTKECSYFLVGAYVWQAEKNVLATIFAA